MHDDLNELQHQQLTTVARLAEYRRKLNDLSHRILKVCYKRITICFNNLLVEQIVSIVIGTNIFASWTL